MCSDYDEERYRRVLIACDLAEDVEAWADGDATAIGEKGVTLSGAELA